jgi:drug/metabolite transporter (DMT)-like permease
MDFAAVYLIWGSTYLAIRFAIETLPGLTMAGIRFLIAGGLLYAWARWRGAQAPTREQWRNAAIIGGLLLLGGNGLVVWAEHYVPSSWAALLVGTEPLWVVILLLLGPGSKRPPARTIVAITIGFAGVVVLTAPGSAGSDTGMKLFLPALLALPMAALSWAGGSLYARNANLPRSAPLATSTQMLTGGALLLLTGGTLGEWHGIDPSTFSSTSLLAFAYLVVFGSLIAFSAYAWLVRNIDPTLAATYAYVNPVVAVALGWWLADEPVSLRTLFAATLIVGAVVLLSMGKKRPRARVTAASREAIRDTVESVATPMPSPHPNRGLDGTGGQAKLDRCA